MRYMATDPSSPHTHSSNPFPDLVPNQRVDFLSSYAPTSWRRFLGHKPISSLMHLALAPSPAQIFIDTTTNHCAQQWRWSLYAGDAIRNSPDSRGHKLSTQAICFGTSLQYPRMSRHEVLFSWVSRNTSSFLTRNPSRGRLPPHICACNVLGLRSAL